MSKRGRSQVAKSEYGAPSVNTHEIEEALNYDDEEDEYNGKQYTNTYTYIQ